MVETIFTNPFFIETVLPLLLIFTVVFAILEKTKILGDGKRQIDAIVALVISLIFVAFGRATDIVVRMIPILGVALIVILIFMILLGSVYGEGQFSIDWRLKVAIGILIAILVIAMVLILTGGLDYLLTFIYGDNSGLLINGVLVLVIIGAIVAVVWGGKDKESGKGK
ncbi:MAG: hypothetical protein AABX83_00885 [Nanoarchaeota archaeon]